MTASERNGPSSARRRCRVDAASVPQRPVRRHSPCPSGDAPPAPRWLTGVTSITSLRFGDIIQGNPDHVDTVGAGPPPPPPPSPQWLLRGTCTQCARRGDAGRRDRRVQGEEERASQRDFTTLGRMVHSLKFLHCCFWNFPFTLSRD